MAQTKTKLAPTSSMKKIITLILLSYCFRPHNIQVSATNIKWTGGGDHQIPQTGRTNKQGESAQTAPRSQKYWDEHGIERPDYAKTDTELAHDRRVKQTTNKKAFAETGYNPTDDGSIKNSTWFIFVAFLLAGIVSYGKWKVGSRLGRASSQWSFSFQSASVEDARKARLARFEQPSSVTPEGAVDKEK